MTSVKTVKIDGESIHVFNSAIYIFKSNSKLTLQLDMIVSEIVVKKYKKEETLIIEVELENGKIINSIMYVKVLSGGLPQLNLFSELDDMEEFKDLDLVNESDSWFPNIENGITIEQIRRVEMPNEEISIKLMLPIDQVEWLRKQKKSHVNELFKNIISQVRNEKGIKF